MHKVKRTRRQGSLWQVVARGILRSALLGGESERAFFAFFKLGCRKHTTFLADGA
jgi:hypothetical protein